MMTIFDEKIEIRERCKGVHCVDLGESFPTNIYLQKSASIQPRTSPSKFGLKFNSLFICLLRPHPAAAGAGVGRRRGLGLRALLAHAAAVHDPHPFRAAARLRSEVNNSLIIVNFFHKIQNFRQISDLFSQI